MRPFPVRWRASSTRTPSRRRIAGHGSMIASTFTLVPMAHWVCWSTSSPASECAWPSCGEGSGSDGCSGGSAVAPQCDPAYRGSQHDRRGSQLGSPGSPKAGGDTLGAAETDERRRAGSARRTIDSRLMATLWAVVSRRRSVMLSSEAPQAGKTTALSAMVDFLPDDTTGSSCVAGGRSTTGSTRSRPAPVTCSSTR